MAEYKEPENHSFLVIPVLGFLTGMPLDQHTKNFLVALRPSAVREATTQVKSDSKTWRVTVWLEGDVKSPRIKRIEQEVKVGLEGGHRHGFDLETYMIGRGVTDLSE